MHPSCCRTWMTFSDLPNSCRVDLLFLLGPRQVSRLLCCPDRQHAQLHVACGRFGCQCRPHAFIKIQITHELWPVSPLVSEFRRPKSPLDFYRQSSCNWLVVDQRHSSRDMQLQLEWHLEIGDPLESQFASPCNTSPVSRKPMHQNSTPYVQKSTIIIS
jgi:hypothetical protein